MLVQSDPVNIVESWGRGGGWVIMGLCNGSMYGSTHMMVHYPVVSHYGTGW